MRCKQARRHISPYIDDELGKRDRAAFLEHVGTCPTCRQELEKTEVLGSMFADARRLRAPHGFAARVMAGIEERSSGGFWEVLFSRTVFLRALEIAFALVVVIIGIISGNALVAEPTEALTTAVLRASFRLDVFEPAPPDSIGGIYVAMTGVRDAR